jgi:hypothetical protein
MGVRQKAKLEKAFRDAYAIGREEGRWPTLRTLDDQLDADLAGVMGDLTRHELFKSGKPLGDVIDHNVVFGLSRIPGNGQTTILAAGFILSAMDGRACGSIWVACSSSRSNSAANPKEIRCASA